jgi:hypothetical protein
MNIGETVANEKRKAHPIFFDNPRLSTIFLNPKSRPVHNRPGIIHHEYEYRILSKGVSVENGMQAPKILFPKTARRKTKRIAILLIRVGICKV